LKGEADANHIIIVVASAVREFLLTQPEKSRKILLFEIEC